MEDSWVELEAMAAMERGEGEMADAHPQEGKESLRSEQASYFKA